LENTTVTPRVYYNEVDPHAAQFLRNLIAAGDLPAGDVDTRDIRDVLPSNLAPYAQCHFFAGCGIWAKSLALAGWRDADPIWTGSCPCQPLSAAGKGLAFEDERHLWPDWHWLIEQCRPKTIFGEQVASADGLKWADLVSADLEAADYAFGPVDTCAAGFGGFHIRQRLYFSATDNRVADASSEQRRLANRRPWEQVLEDIQRGALSGMADAQRLECNSGPGSHHQTKGGRRNQLADRSCDYGPGTAGGGWGAADWLLCQDAKWRPVEPRTFPLADAYPGRVGALRAFGNALDLGQATAFVTAFLERHMDLTTPAADLFEWGA
jgi:DNA (cytosine-5)-methyltransferase 1